METVSFSIIVVSLNTKKDLYKTLKSIFRQKFKKYEIIIVDGKSNDGSIELIKNLKKKNVKKIIEKDKGIYDAMNKGLKKIKNNWVIFLNSGDVFYKKNTLTNVKKCILNNRNADIIIGKNVLSNKPNRLTKFKRISKNTYSSSFSHQSIYFKKKIFEYKKYNINYKIAADFELMKYLYYKNYKIIYSNYVFSSSKPEGISDKKRFIAIREFYKISRKYDKSLFLNLWYYNNIVYIIIVNLLKLILPKEMILLVLKLKNYIK